MPDDEASLISRVRRFAMPHGAVGGGGTWLRQRGEMRFAPDRSWMPFTAEQSFNGSGIDFRWVARVRMAPMVSARVVDAFENGAGSLVARVFGIIPVARARGPETDIGEALRGLADLPWHPMAFGQGSSLNFEAVSPNRLRATFDNGKTSGVLDFDVDGEGRVLSVTVASRPRVVGKLVINTPWSGTFRDYRECDGRRVPTAAEVTWHLPEGPFTYWRGRVTEFRVVRRPARPT